MTTSESLQLFLKLERSTAECDEGPEVTMRPGIITIRYDTETDAGREWTTLRFLGAVAIRVTPEPAVSAMVARAYSMVAVIDNSAWMASMNQACRNGKLPSNLKHFVLFFDHYGGIEAIARSCEVEE